MGDKDRVAGSLLHIFLLKRIKVTEMSKIIHSLVQPVVDHFRLTLAVVFFISTVFMVFFVQQEHDNNIGVFFNDDDPVYQLYQDFVDEYGSEEFVMVAMRDDHLFAPETIELIRALTDGIASVEGVERVISLTNVEEIVGKEDEVLFTKIIPEGALSNDALQGIKETVTSNTLLQSSLISRDGCTTAIFTELYSLNQDEKKVVLGELTDVTQKIAAGKTQLYYSGIPYLETEINRMSQIDIRTFSPITALLIFIITIMLFRNFLLACLALGTLFITQIWGMGLYVMCGEKLSYVTSPMSAILLAMAIADSVHLLSHFQKTFPAQGMGYNESIVDATKTVWLPCLFTTLTTSIGFFSFVAAPLRPSQMLGVFTAIGVIFAFVIDVTFLPAALRMLRKPIEKALVKRKPVSKDTGDGLFSRILIQASLFATRYCYGLLLVFVALFVFSIVGITQLKFETNSSQHLHDSNRLKQDALFLDKNIGGAIPFMMLLKAKGDIDFTQPEALKKAALVQQVIANHDKDYVTNVTSIVDYIKEFNMAFHNNDDAYRTIPDLQSDIVDFYEIADADIVERMVSDDRKELCVAFLSKWGSNERAVESYDFYESYLGAELGDDYEFEFTGITTLYIAMEELLKISQRRSLFVAFVLIFIMMLFMCRHFVLAMISMLPNVFPIVMTLGIMGWLKIPLDVATIMIASVTLGIAVDDTIHFVAWYKRLSGPGIRPKDAIRQTFLTVGKPIVITTILLFIGFGVLVLGNFRPTQVFGVLTAFSMLFALIGDFFMLPALILILKPKVNGEGVSV